jgi:hypothetical protein
MYKKIAVPFFEAKTVPQFCICYLSFVYFKIRRPWLKPRNHLYIIDKMYYFMALSKRSTFWHFWPESDDINLGEITIFCYLNCISECINGFSVLKNPGVLRLYRLNHSNLQIQQFLVTDFGQN